MQIRATIKKLLREYAVSELLRRMADELELQANYLAAHGSPDAARQTDIKVSTLRAAVDTLEGNPVASKNLDPKNILAVTRAKARKTVKVVK